MSCRPLLAALLIFAPDRVSAGPSSHGDAVALLQANECSSSGGECLRDDKPQNAVAMIQTNLQMNVPKGSTHAVATPEDHNLQPNSGTPSLALVQPSDIEGFSPIAKPNAPVMMATSGTAGASDQTTRMLPIAILFALVIGGLLAARRAWPESNLIAALIVGGLYICTSACMIETNKWLMLPGHFPFPLTLTTNHMLTSWILAGGLRVICPSAFPAMDKIEVTRSFCLKFVPLGAAFALSIVCGNAAYKSLSVSFLQVVKQCNVVNVYVFSVICGLEALRRCSVALLFVTFCGTIMAIHGEMHFVLGGFVLQVVSSLSEATKIVMQSVLMSGTCKLDPLTMVFFMAPACLLANVIPFMILEAPKSAEIVAQFHLVMPMIIFNAMLAFSLNLVVAQCIKQLSAVGFLLAGIVKDISIISTSALFLGESLSTQQLVGFSIALSGVSSYSMYKQNVDCFQDDHLLQGFSRVAERLFGWQNDKIPVANKEPIAKGDSK